MRLPHNGNQIRAHLAGAPQRQIFGLFRQAEPQKRPQVYKVWLNLHP